MLPFNLGLVSPRRERGKGINQESYWALVRV